MNLAYQVFSLPVSYDAYIRHGWSLVPIIPGSKGPNTKGWNRKENCLVNSGSLPAGWGVGLAHAYSGTMALDADHLEMASTYLKQHGIDLEALFNAPDGVTVESGNKGHGKLLYAMPFGLSLPSYKLMGTDETGKRINYLDFRCATRDNLTVQDVLPPSIHPVTQQPYRWGGRGKWEALPTIPMELLTLWQDLLTENTSKSIKTDDPIDASWDEVQSALESIDPDCPHDQWVQVGMALHDTGTKLDKVDQAFNLWDQWSATGTKYKQGETAARWRSFKTGHGVSIGTLFHHAKETGWSRPTPDVSTLFADVTPEAPAQVIDLMTMRMQPPVLKTEYCPKVLAQRASEVATSRGCDPVIPLFAGLSAACAVVDSRIRLELLPGFEVPPVLWIMTIGDPSDKKTPGSKPMFGVIKDIQIEDIDRFKAEHLMWRGREAAHVASMKAFMDHQSDVHSQLANDHIPTVIPLPDEPKSLRLVVEDATSQKIVHLAQGRPYGFLLNMDEMGNWVRKVNDARSTEDRGCWIAGYESREYTMDRVGAGTISAEQVSVSIYGNLQPKVFKDELTKAAQDGMLQRFIPVVVRGDLRKKGKPIPQFMTNELEYELLLRRLRTVPVRKYQLSADAFDAFDQFQDWYNQLVSDERMLKTDGPYMEALGKIEGTLGRLCLVFHLIENPDSLSVTGLTMRNAINVIKSYVIPSLRYVYQELTDQESSFERWCIDQIVHLASEKQTITVSELRRSARRQIEDKPSYVQQNLTRAVMDTLELSGWLKLIEEKKDNATFAINPGIASIYADYRKAVVTARQRVREYLTESITYWHGKEVKKPPVLGYVKLMEESHQ